MHDQQTRSKARTMYVQTRSAIPTISVSLDVAEGTIRRWKAAGKEVGDDWDIARAAATMQGEGLDAMVSATVEDFTVMFQATMEQVKEAGQLDPSDKVKLMASLSDAFHKMVLAAGRAAPQLSKLGIAMDVLHRLAEYVLKHAPQHRTAFEEILEPFGAELAKAYQ